MYLWASAAFIDSQYVTLFFFLLFALLFTDLSRQVNRLGTAVVPDIVRPRYGYDTELVRVRYGVDTELPTGRVQVTMKE